MSSYFILAIDYKTNRVVISENIIGTRLKEDIYINKKKKKNLIEDFSTQTVDAIIDMIEIEEIIFYTVKELSIGYYVGSEVQVIKENNKKHLRTKRNGKLKDNFGEFLSVDEFYERYDNYII